MRKGKRLNVSVFKRKMYTLPGNIVFYKIFTETNYINVNIFKTKNILIRFPSIFITKYFQKIEKTFILLTILVKFFFMQLVFSKHLLY